jgi:hypothetical protein
MSLRRHCLSGVAIAAMLVGQPAFAQSRTAKSAGAAPRATAPRDASLALGSAGYYEAPGVNWLVFSNWYDGLFADAKISGVELIQQEVRTITNGDVRLSATPGQWDPIGRLVDRKVDAATGTIEATLEYPQHGFRYVIRTRAQGNALRVTIDLPAALPAALAGKAGFNLEFLPSAYMHRSFLADTRGGTFPLHPASRMVATPERNAASGRSDGAGAEALPMATGASFVMAPDDASRRVSVRAASGEIALYDGRNQAQNGWFVLRQLLPAGRTGRVLDWTLDAAAAPGWLRTPVIAHSQLGYAPDEAKIATIELDRRDRTRKPVRLLKVAADGTRLVASGTASAWGDYLRYRYLRYDFSKVREPGVYQLEYGSVRTAPFRIAPDLYAEAWAPSLDVYLPVAMDHMFVNEAYRVWHGDPHRDDARQAPLDHEHIDLYRQGPTTDTPFAPGEHIPGLAVGGWLDAGDFDIRTQTQYQVIRSLVDSWEQFRPDRDTTTVDQAARRAELHVPDGAPDLLQQIRHGTLQLVAQVDAVGHAIHGIVEPDVGQYTHLGDASTKTDGLVYDAKLAGRAAKDSRSGVPDDRWAFTSRASALDYGSAAGMAAAARALKGFDDPLAAKALAIAQRLWREEQGRAPATFSHGNTTGGPLASERFAAAVELLLATGDQRYADAVMARLPEVLPSFEREAATIVKALPRMPAAYRLQIEPAVRAWAVAADAHLKANPYGVPITTGGWAGNGAVLDLGLTAYALHRAFPAIVGTGPVFRSLAYLHGHHPGSDISFVSGVGTRSKEVAYGNNRADFSYIAGGVVPGVLVIKPDFPENKEDWPFFWGENEYVVPEAAAYIQLANAAAALTGAPRATAGGQPAP